MDETKHLFPLGAVSLRISSTADWTLVKLTQLQHVDILATPKRTGQEQTTRLKVQTVSMGVLLFDLVNEAAAQRCYLLLTTLRCE